MNNNLIKSKQIKSISIEKVDGLIIFLIDRKPVVGWPHTKIIPDTPVWLV